MPDDYNRSYLQTQIIQDETTQTGTNHQTTYTQDETNEESSISPIQSIQNQVEDNGHFSNSASGPTSQPSILMQSTRNGQSSRSPTEPVYGPSRTRSGQVYNYGLIIPGNNAHTETNRPSSNLENEVAYRVIPNARNYIIPQSASTEQFSNSQNNVFSQSQIERNGQLSNLTVGHSNLTESARNRQSSRSPTPTEPAYGPSRTRSGQVYNYGLIIPVNNTHIETNSPSSNSENETVYRVISNSRSHLITQSASTEQSSNSQNHVISQSHIEINGQPTNLTVSNSNLTQSTRNGQSSPTEPVYGPSRTRSGRVYNDGLMIPTYNTDTETNGSSDSENEAVYRMIPNGRNYVITQSVSTGQSSTSQNHLISKSPIERNRQPSNLEAGYSILTQSDRNRQSSCSQSGVPSSSLTSKKPLNCRYKLPKRSVPQDELDELRCGICLRDAKEVKLEKRPVAKTICGHFFCASCINKWQKLSGNCPMCRQRVLRQRNGIQCFHLM